MLSLRLFRGLLLWVLVALAFARGWYSSVAAWSYDGRVPWDLVPWAPTLCLGAWAAATLLGQLLARRRPQTWARLDFTRHGLGLLATMLCVHAISHVGPHMSIRVLREEVPPIFAPMYPALCLLLPLWLRRSATHRDAAEQTLLVVIFATALSGAVFFLDPPLAVGLGVLALAMQFDEGHLLPGRSLLLWAGALFLLLCGVATALAYSELMALPALQWITGLSLLALAIGMRPRGGEAWRAILASSVLAAVLVALCGALLTAYLARHVALEPALRTRLVLFQQHPNFLAPFFGFHAVLAVALGLRRQGSSVGWWLAAALLAVSTLMTDSRTGIGALLLALLLIPVVYVVAAAARRWRLRLRLILPVALTLLALLIGGGWAFGGERVTELARARLDRLENSLDFRYDAWRNSVAVIRQSPWLGIGPHNFIALARFTPGSRFFNAPEAPHPHNLFLYVAQSAGLPALLLFLAWIAALVAGLWRGVRDGSSGVPRPLLAGLLAGTACLLVANLFDLGMSLLSVVPGPLFLITGLQLSVRRPRRERPRSWIALVWTVALLAVVVPLGLQPLRALARVEQGEIYSWEATSSESDAWILARARLTLQRALELDPAVPRAAEELARWHEAQPGGFDDALAVLTARLRLAPHDEQLLSEIGHLYLRAGMFKPAREHLELALLDAHGSPDQSQDRADLVVATAMLGERDHAVDLLADALRQDVGVFHRLPWLASADGRSRLAVGGTPKQSPIELIEAVERLFDRHRADEEAGRPVGRTFWMGNYRAFRFAGRDDRAADLLDYAEQHLQDEVEPFTIASERGALAFDSGNFARAREQFDLAAELSPGGIQKGFYQMKSAMARRALGENTEAVDQLQSAMADFSEILDAPSAFVDDLDEQIGTQRKLGNPGAAARLLERRLLFEDDILKRAAILEQAGGLYLKGGEPRECVRALTDALELYAAKPFPWPMLADGATGSLPGRLATLLCDAWKALGYDQRGREHEFWGLPDRFSHLLGPSLFRLAFFAENVQVDKYLREADVQLLADPGNLIALWARLFALEACGRHLDLAAAMRTIVEEYGRVASAERQFNQIYAGIQDHLDDPVLLQQAGVLKLLQGRYAEAVNWFDYARQQFPDDPTAAADVCSWEAMAAFLASQPDKAREVLLEGQRLDPGNEMFAVRLAVMPAAP